MSLSRWTDNTESGMDEIISNILNYKDWNVPGKDPLTNEDLAFYVSKVFESNKEMELNDTPITYNLINYDYEKIRPGEEVNEMRSSRIYSLNGYILIYSDESTTQYIINKSNNDSTKTILRKINNYTGQLEIKSNPFLITEDLFTWMISKVLNNTSESIDESSELYIEKIIGFKGSSDDRLAEVRGSGNRIMNALSTLAFLFENEEVSYVKPIIQYNNNTIELLLNTNGTIDVNFDTYLGDYFMEHFEEKKAKVILMITLETIPKIISSYGNSIDVKEWSLDKKIDFINEIGENIQLKVNEKIKALTSVPASQ